MKFIDLTGQKFGRLTAVEKCGKDSSGKNSLWLCTCDCGGTTRATTTHLRNGHTQSCGCLGHERLISCGKATQFKPVHGLRKTRIYRIWCGMKSRCYDPNHPKYPLYGSRGIKVCEEWLHNAQAFYDWAVSHNYASDLTIDRINSDGDYEPDNCRWASIAEQNRNRKFRRKVDG